jgi:transcriptional regulator with PAS, ATPase and Fis domain
MCALISATNANLAEMVARQGRFARISSTASTWSRRACPRCASAAATSSTSSHFFERADAEVADPDPMLQILVSYLWPGNVRELENEIERVMALHGAPDALAPDMFRTARNRSRERQPRRVSCASPAAAVTHLEENLLKRTLAQTNWNKSQSARKLGLSRQGLIKKIKRYGIVRNEASK